MRIRIHGYEFDPGDVLSLEPLLHRGEEAPANASAAKGIGDVKLAHEAIRTMLEERRLAVDGCETISDNAGMMLGHAQE